MFTQGRIRVLALGIADIACVCTVWTAVVVSYWLLGAVLSCIGVETAIGGYSPADYAAFWPVPFFFVVINSMFALYHGNWMYPAAPIPPIEEMRRLAGSSLLTHVGTIAFLAFAHQTTEDVSRVVVAVSGLASALVVQSFRNWMRSVMYRFGVGQIPVFLAGTGDVAEYVANVLGDDPYTGMRIEGYFDGLGGSGLSSGNAAMETRGIRCLGTLRDIVPEAKKHDVKILLACQDERFFRRQMEEFSQWFTYIEFLPTVHAFPVFGSRPISFGGVGGLEMVNQRRMKMERVVKRLLDVFLSLCVFVALSPFFVIIPVLIKATSEGNVFFRQERLGKNGKRIRIWKFRSMYKDAEDRLSSLLKVDSGAADEWKRNFKLSDDPRITPLGRFLRRTSLDELPQLFNVFAGDMALVGPRPIVDREVDRYGESYSVVSSVMPGITGLWQVSGRSDTDYVQRVALDVHYVLNWSPWMDIWILVRTVCAVVFMRGAR